MATSCRAEKETLVAASNSNAVKMSRQVQIAVKTAVKEQPPKVRVPLDARDFRPNAAESQLIRELYEWGKQSARVQFRMGCSRRRAV